MRLSTNGYLSPFLRFFSFPSDSILYSPGGEPHILPTRYPIPYLSSLGVVGPEGGGPPLLPFLYTSMIVAPLFAALLLVLTCESLGHPFGSRGTMHWRDAYANLTVGTGDGFNGMRRILWNKLEQKITFIYSVNEK